MIEPRPGEEIHVSEGIRKSQEAFFRDLPELLKDRRLRGRYIAYHGNERIGIGGDDEPLIRECLGRGLKREEYDILIIEPQSADPEEIDYPSPWYGVPDPMTGSRRRGDLRGLDARRHRSGQALPDRRYRQPVDRRR